MSLADTFQQVVDSLPDDWTDLELDLRIADESRYIDAATYVVTCNAQPYSRHDWHWRLLVAHRFGHAAAPSAVHTALAAGRCALAQHRRLFRGQKYLGRDLAALTELPAGFLEAWWTVVDAPTPKAARALVAVVDAWLGGPLTVDDALSRFVDDNELAWLRGTIPPEFW